MESKLPPVLEELVKNIKKLQQQPSPQWRHEKPTHEDLSILEKESQDGNTFDKLNIRTTLRNDFQSGNAKLTCMVCKYGKVLLLQKKEQGVQIPLETWGRILQAFGGYFRILWFAADVPRILPQRGHLVGPEHVNGGYTFACNSSAIVIYREEEATRVLIHELLHGSCSDLQTTDLVKREANTETWAELFLVAILSKGDMKLARKLWDLQSHWIADQNNELKKHYNVHTSQDYAYRYTVAREHELKELGIALPPVSKKNHVFHTARFTSDKFDDFL